MDDVARGSLGEGVSASPARHGFAPVQCRNAVVDLSMKGENGVSKIDVSSRIERIGPMEDRLGVELQALYAVFEEDEYDARLKVNFDVSARTGKIDENIQVTVSAYNGQGQLVGTSNAYLYAEEFMGFASCSETLWIGEPPAKLRVFPQRS